MPSLSVFSPAKLNLYLAVTGRRADGFHELVSVVAPLDLGDILEVTLNESRQFSLECDHRDLAIDESNLVLRAAHAFARRASWRGGARFALQKRIPIGAGLGGGSSNAVATLKALNELTGDPLDRAALLELAAELGSDCPLFLHEGPVVMRGRGEVIEPLPVEAAARLAGQRVLVFKPAFGVNTTWAYRQLAAAATAFEREGAPSPYLAPEVAEAQLTAWLADASAPAEALGFNSLERPVFEKFVALPTLLERLREHQSWRAHMSGSGSACFGFVTEERASEPLMQEITAAWGITSYIELGRIAAQMTLKPG